MLTKDIIKSNSVLAALTDEQIAAITQLSQNDENEVIAAKVREIHTQYDRDIEEVTGLKKPGDVKTYQWLKTDILPKAKAASDLTGQIETLKTEKAELEKKIKNGSNDTALKAQLEDLQKQLGDKQAQIDGLQSKLKTDLEEWQKKYEDERGKNTHLQLDYEFEKGLAGVKFKSGIPESTVQDAIAFRKQQILNQYKPDFQEGKMIFRDKEGKIVQNQANGLNPYTPGEFLKEKLSDLIDTGQQAAGAGTQPNGKGGGNGSLSLAGVKTQVEASELIKTSLMQQGLARGTKEFAEAEQKAWQENKVSELPMR